MHAITRYTFTVRGCDTAWHVRKVELHESLSQPYTLTLELLTSDHDLTPADLLGASCRLTLAHSPGPARDVHGLVLRVTTLDHDDHQRHFRLDIGPALALHAHRVDTRLWQHTSVPDIVKDVLEDSLTAHGRRLRLDLAAAYPPRETCTQYRESDLEFVQRLLHEEGISFTFDHDDDAEVLVLLDDNSRCPVLGSLPFIPRGADTVEAETIDRLDPARALGVTCTLQRDWSPMHAADAPFEHHRHGHDDRGRERLVFDHDDRRIDLDDGHVRVRRKHEQHILHATTAAARSTALMLAPARRFDLAGHPDSARDARHLVLEIHHHGEVPDADQLATYHNTFTCIPDTTKLRPPLSPHLRRPRVHGPHTAIVVGPEGEEIHTDEHGRIRVRFHWDRAAASDQSSCWIPVAQTSAGAGWGALFLPRVGMEVVVQFLDGDPDRPLVIGCVYNSLLRPPHPLPEQKTRSALTSESTPGGGLANQIQFEDARHREFLNIQTRRDLHTRAGHDHTADIVNNLTTTVGQNLTTDVGANQITTVIGNCTLTVADGDLTTTVTTGSRETTIHGDDLTTVVTGHSNYINSLGSHTVQAQERLCLQSDRSDIGLRAHGKICLQATNDLVDIAAGAAVKLRSQTAGLHLTGTTTTVVEAGKNIRLEAGDNFFVKTTNGDVKIKASGSATLRSADETKVVGQTIVVSADEQLELCVGNSAIVLTPEGIEIRAPSITSAAVGHHVIAGAMIRLN